MKRYLVCWPTTIQDLVRIISIALMTIIRMMGADLDTDEYLHEILTSMTMMTILMIVIKAIDIIITRS